MSEPEFPRNLASLMEEFTRSGLREVHIRKGDFELYLSTGAGPALVSPPRPAARQGAAMPAPAPAPAGPTPNETIAPIAVPKGAMVVNAPNLGTFYRSPKPGTPPFVEIGQNIVAGDELCLIEVMKLFTTLKSNVSGRLSAVLVEDGAMVEAGQPLFAVVAE